MTTEQPIIERLSNGAAVMLRARAGKPKGGARARHSRFMPKGLSLALASAFSAAGASISQTLAGLSITLAGLSQAQAQSQAAALPQGGVAVHGGATIQQSGKTLNVNTTNGAGNKSIINWQSFNIGAGHTTNINQPNAQSSSLNRVVTNVPSQIYGTLRSNGQVILVNQNGIAVGSGGVVDTAGFTASTLNISDADYKAGRLRFEGHALSGGVQVDGVIRSSNGDVVLFAPQIATGKDAVVKADNGNVIVGAGQSVEVTGRGLEGVRFIIQGADNKAINLGTLQGNAVGVFAGTLRHSGVIQAQQATMEGGRVLLRAVKDVEISKDAQSVSPAGPRIQADGGVNAAGAAQAGGSVRIESAQGDVRIGAGSQISANAAVTPVSGSNQATALANAAGGAIDIIAAQGRVITEAGSVISATGSPGGTIRIVGAQGASVASVLNASSPSRGAVEQAGSLVLITTQDVGGRIEVLSPADVSLQPGAELLVSGDAGGGTILVGGDYQGENAAIVNAQNTNVSAGVLLEANARSLGDGGKVIVWADNDTHFSGTLHAKGGEQGGDGGFGETSGKKNLYFRGRADLSARRGRSGTLLLDPEALTINGSDGSSGTSDPNFVGGTISAGSGGATATVYEADIELLGMTSNVVLEASGSINFQGSFTDDKLAVSKSLTFRTRNAVGDITSGGISLGGWGNHPSLTITAGENLNIQAGSGYTGTISGAPNIFSNSGASLVLHSATGNILLEAAGEVALGKGTSLVASNGNVTVRSKLSDVTLGHGSTGPSSNFSAKSILLQSQGADGLVSILNDTSLTASDAGVAIHLMADRLSMSNDAAVTASAGSITIRPNDNSRLIKLGASTDLSGSGSLQISQDEHNNFSASSGAIRYGDTATFIGNLVLGAENAFSLGFNNTALLTNGGTITQSFGVSANKLRMQASSIVLGAGANSFNQLAAQTTAGAMSLSTGSSNVFITTVDGLSGLTSASSLSFNNTNLGTTNLYLDGGNISTQGNISITNFKTLGVFSGAQSIDSNTSNSGNSGSINLAVDVIQGNTPGVLTIDSSSANAVGGAIGFANVVTNTLAQTLGGLVINSSGSSAVNAGSVNLPSSLTVGANGLYVNGRVMLTQDVSVNTFSNGQVSLLGEVQGNKDLSINASGPVSVQAEMGTGTALNDISITSANVISISNRIKADGNLSLMANSAGSVNMTSGGEIEMIGTGSAGARSIHLFGQGSVQLGKIKGTNAYNATVQVGSSGSAITTASNTLTNFEGAFNAISLGTAANRPNVGASSAPIVVNTPGFSQFSARASTALYVSQSNSSGSLYVSDTSVDTGTSSTAHASIYSAGDLIVWGSGVGVLGTGTAHVSLRAGDDFNLLSSISGNSNSDLLISANRSIDLGVTPGAISNFAYARLQGTAGGQNIRFVDSLGSPPAGNVEIDYDSLPAISNTVSHVIIGAPDHSGGAITFDGSSGFNPGASGAKNYSFFSGSSISSPGSRQLLLNQAGFSAVGNIDLDQAELFGTSLVAGHSSSGRVELVVDRLTGGVTVGSVGGVTGSPINGLSASTAGMDASIENDTGAIVFATDSLAGSQLKVRAAGALEVNAGVTLTGSGSGGAGMDTAILIEANDLVLNGVLDANGRDIGMAPYTANTSLSLGGTGAGFVLSGAELANITDFRDVYLGTTGFAWGNVTITGGFNLGAHNLHIETGDPFSVSQAAAGVITASGLSVVSGDIQLAAASNAVSTFTAEAIGSSGDVAFKASGSFALGGSGVMATLSSSGDIQLISGAGSISNPNFSVIRSKSGEIDLSAATGIGSQTQRVITKTSGVVSLAAPISGDIYVESMGDLTLASVSTSSSTNVVSIFSPNNLNLTQSITGNDQVTLNSGGGVLDFGAGSITGALANLSGSQGIVGGTAPRDVDVTGALAMFSNGTVGNIGGSSSPISARANTFSVNTTGANSANGHVYIDAEPASGSTLQTSDIGLNVGGSAPVVRLRNVAGTPTININSNIMTGLNYALTLDAAGGSIEVNQPNAVSSGSSPITLIADSTRVNTILDVSNQVNVTSGDSTLTSPSGLLRGSGTWNNAGRTLNIDGLLSPGGGSVATLSVSGNLSMGSSGRLNMQIDNSGNHDRLVISGSFNAGGTLSIAENTPFASVGTAYTIGTVSGTATGSYTSVASSGGTFSASVGSNLTVTPTSLVNFWLNNAGSTLWSSGSNWSRGVVPNADHDVLINPTGTGDTNKLIHLNTSGTTSINSLSITGDDHLQISGASANLSIASTSTIASGATLSHAGAGAIQGAGDINLSGNFLWSGGGIVAGSGTLNSLAGAQVSISSSAANLGRRWNNYGTVTQNSALSLTAAGQYFNEALGTHHVNYSSTGFGIALATLTSATNRGTMNWTNSAATVSVGAATNAGSFHNEGTLNVSANSYLRLLASGTDTGAGSSYNVDTGGVLDFNSGTRSISADSGIYGLGTFKVSGGSVTLTGPLDLANSGTLTMVGGTLTAQSDIHSGSVGSTGMFNLSGGIINGSGNLNVHRNMTWSNGTLDGTGGFTIQPTNGHVTIAAGASPTLNRAARNLGTVTVNDTLTLNNTLTNEGLINLKPLNAISVLDGTGTLLNNANATLSTTAGTLATDYAELNIALQNNGLGEVRVDGSHLLMLKGVSNAGLISIASGKELRHNPSAAQTFASSGSIVNNGGQLSVAGVSTATISGGYSGASSTVNLEGGTLTFDQDISIGHLAISGGTINGAGDINTTTMSRSGGVIGASAGATLSTSGLVSHTGGTGGISRDWYVNGGFNYTGGQINLGSGVTLTNGAGSLLDFQASYFNGGINTVDGLGVIVNDGTMRNSFTGGSVGDSLALSPSALHNNGSIVMANGARTLGLNAAGTHSSGSSLTIPAGQRVNFQAGGTYLFQPGSALVNDGTLYVSHGSTVRLQSAPSGTGTLGLGFNGTFGAATASFESGSAVTLSTLLADNRPSAVIRGSDSVTVNNASTLNMSVELGSGGFTLGPAVNALSTDGIQLSGAGTFRNEGAVNLSGVWLGLAGSAVLENAGSWTLSGSSSVQNFGASGSIVNASGGVFNFNSGSTNPVEVAFNNQSVATLNVQSGTATFSSLPLQAGTLFVASGATAAADSGQSIVNTGLLTGAGTVKTSGGGNLSSSGGTISPGGLGTVATLSIAGNTDLTGATLLFDLESGSNDRIAVTGNLNTGGATAKLYESGGAHIDVSEAFTLASYSANLSGAALALQSQNADISFTGSSTGSSNGALLATASAITNRWVDASGSLDWATGSNWSRTHAPTASEDAIINPSEVGRAVTLSAGVQAARSLTLAGNDRLLISGGSLNLTSLSSFGSASTLSVTGGSVGGAGGLQLDGHFNWSGGTIGGAGTLVTSTGSNVGISGDVLAQRNWSHNGSLSFTGSSRLTLDNAIFNNLSGASVSVGSSFGTPIQLSNSGQWNNQGTMNWNTNAASMVDGVGSFSNQSGGVVNINGTSTLRLNATGGGTDAGAYNTVAGSRLNLSTGNRTLAAGMSFNGPGTLEVSGGTALISAPSLAIGTGSTLAFSGGTINGAGHLNVDGIFNWSAGTMAGSGSLDTGGGAISSITGGVFQQRNWFNAGSITMTGASTLTLNASLANLSGGTISMDSNYNGPVIYLDGSSQMSNAGTISWNSGASALNSAIGGAGGGSFHNNGQFNLVGNSSLAILIGGTDSGTYSISGGSLLKFSSGTRSMAVASQVDGGGRFVNSGATTTANGAFAIASTGTLEMTGGSLTLNTASAPNFNNPLVMTGGTLTLNTPDVVFDVPVTVSGATLNGAADFDFAAGSSLSLQNATIGGAGTLGSGTGISTTVTSASTIGRNWTNSGTISMTGASSYLTLDRDLNNLASGVLNVGSSYDGPVIYLNSATGQFNNAGAINWNSGPAATASSVDGTAGSSFSHSGQFNVTGNSTVSVSVPSFSQMGTIDIAAGSTFKRSIGLANAGLLRGGGTLDVVGAGSLSSASGTIAPGGIGSSATLSIAGNADLTGAALLFDLMSSGSDRLVVSGHLNSSATGITLAESGGAFLGYGDAFSLMTYGGSLSGSAPALSYGIADVSFGLTNTGASAGAWVATVNGVTNRWKDTPVNYDWSVAGNWTRGHAPRSGEDVVIAPLSGTRTITIAGGSHEIRSLSLSDDDSLRLSAGNLDIFGSGSTASTIGSAASLRVDGTAYLRLAQSHLTNSGTIELNDSGSVMGAALGPGAGTLTNASSGSILKLSGVGTSQVGAVGVGPMFVYNDGTVRSQSGSLQFTGESHWRDGTRFLAGSGTVELQDALSLQGSINMDTGADVHLAGNISAGSATIHGVLEWVSGDIAGSGTSLTVASGGGLNIVGVASHRLGDGATLRNEGVIDFQGDGGIASINLGSGGNGTLVNAPSGLIKKVIGTGTSWLSQDTTQKISVDNQGTVEVSSGTLAIGSGSFVQSGTIALAGGARLRSESNITNTGWIGGTGTIAFAGAATHLLNQGTLAPGDSLAGTIASGIGTLTVLGNLTLDTGSLLPLDLSSSQSDRIQVSGDVTLAAVSGPSFELSEFGGASFQGGETSTLISAGGTLSVGAWGSVSFGDVTFQVEDSANTMVATAIGIRNQWLTATPAGADWSTDSNWSRNLAPNAYHDVVIDVPGGNVVTLSTMSGQARSLKMGQTFGNNELKLSGGAVLDIDNPQNPSGELVRIYSGSRLELDQSTLGLGHGSLHIDSGATLSGQGYTLAAYSAASGNATVINAGILESTGLISRIGQTSGANGLHFDNVGQLNLGGGTLDISAVSFSQTGTVQLASGSTLSLSSLSVFDNQGLLTGTGTLSAGNLSNQGTVAPGTAAGVGTLVVQGSYSQGTSGVLRIRAQSAASYDKLDVSGAANFDGELAFSVFPLSGHAFAAGQVYQPVSATLGEGAFSITSGLSPYMVTSDNSAGMLVTLANPAGSIIWIGTDGDWSNAANWDLGRLPGLGDTVIINPVGTHTVTISSATGFSMFNLVGADDTVLIASGGNLALPGSSTLNGLLHVNGGSLSNDGANTASRLSISSGTFVNNGHLTVDTLSLSGGTATISSGQTLNVGSLGYWNGSAALQGPGTLGIAGGVNFNIAGAGNRVLDGLQLYNQGTLVVALTGGAIEVNNGGLLVNDAGGHIQTGGSTGQQITSTSGTGVLSIQGGHIETGAGSGLEISTSSLGVSGGSSLNASNATINLLPLNASYAGSIDVSGIVLLGAGNHTLSSGTQLIGSGTVGVSQASSNVIVEDISVANTLSVDQGSFQVSGGKTLHVNGGSLLLGQSIGGGGHVRNDGTLESTVAGVTLTASYSGSGTLSPGSSGSVATLTIAGDADLTGAKLHVDLQNSVSYDKLAITGNATLGVGTSVFVQETGAAFVGSSDAFTVLSAGGALTGAAPASITSADSDISYTSSLNAGKLLVSTDTVTTRWNTNANGGWGDAANWSRGHAPREGEDVIIDRGSANPVVTIGSGVDAQAKSVRLSSGDQLELTGTGSLTVGIDGITVDAGTMMRIESGALKLNGNVDLHGVLGWEGGSIEALTPSSAVVVHSGGELSVSTASGVTLGTDAVISVYGTLFWDAGPITFDGDALIHSGGVLRASMVNGPETLAGTGTLTVLSGGQMKVEGPDALTMGLRFENWGLMDLTHSAAHVHLQQGGDHAGGTFSLVAGSSMSFEGSNQTHDLRGAAVTGAGRVEVAGTGTTKVLADSGYLAASTAVQSGELVLDGSAVAQVAVLGGKLSLDQTGTALTSVGNLTLSSGTLSVLANAAIGNSPFSGGTLDIASGATLSSTGSLMLSGSVAGAGGGVLHNSGTLTGSGSLGVGTGSFKNTGTIAPGGASIATITIAGNADLTGGRVEVGLQSTSSYDKLAVAGDLVSGGSLVLSDLSGGTLASGNAFQPISFSGTQSGAAISLDSSAISYLSFASSQASTSASAYTITAGAAASISWDGGGGDGLWSNPFNWSTDLLPVAGQSVTISPAGNIGVTIATGTNIAGLLGLNLDATDSLFITGGSLGLPGANLNLNGAVNLQSGAIVGHALGGSFGGAFNWSGGTMAGSGAYTAANLSMSGTGARTLAMAAGGTLNASNPTFTNAISGGSLSLVSGNFGAGLNMVVSPGSTLSFEGGQLTTSFFRNNGQTRINTGSVSLPVHLSQTGAFVIANGANLEFSRDTTLSSSASVTGGAWSIASGKNVTALGSINRGAGGVTFVNGQLALADLSPAGSGLETDQLIMLSGGSISSAGAGTLKVNQAWTDIGTGSITGFGSATITQASGNLDFNQALAVSGAMKLSANAGNIDSAGAGVTLSAGTLVASASGMIDLMLQASTVSAGSSGGDVHLNMAASTVIGSLSTGAGHVASITSASNVGQTGAINTAGRVELDLGAGSVAWLNGANVFGQGVHLVSANVAQLISSPGSALTVSGQASEVQIGGGAVELGGSQGVLDVSGPLTVVASGNISQGAALNVSGLASLSTSAGSIVLPTLSTYGGGLAFSATGPVQFNADSAVAIRGSTNGNLSLQAAGHVTQFAAPSASLVVGGNTTISAAGSDVILTNSLNDFGGLSVTAGRLSAVDKNSLNLRGSVTGDADVSVLGDLSNSASETFAAANLLVNSTGTTTNISLRANVTGLSTFAGSGYNNISYTNASAGGYSSINAMGLVSITQTGALVSPSIVASSAQLNASGPITQSGTLNVFSLGLGAAGQDVTLANAANSFTSVSGTAANISLASIQNIDPNLNASGTVSFAGQGINQSAGHSITSQAFSANVTGGLGLFGSNQLGSVTANAGADIDIRDTGPSLALGPVSAGNGVSLNATGVVSQASGSVQGSAVSLQGAALGSASAALQIHSPVVHAQAVGGDAYLENAIGSSVEALSAVGTASYRSASAVNVVGDVRAASVQLSSGGHLRIGNSLAPVQVLGDSTIVLEGADVSIVGGAAIGASVRVVSGGDITVTASGDFVIQGGSQSSAFAELFATGPVTVSSLNTVVQGGAGDNAFAKLDPALNSLLTINSSNVDVRGGSGQGAYGVILSQGNIVINANSLNLVEGSGVEADAVVISQFGTISAPSNCNGCLQLSADPMGDGGRSRGIFQGGQSAQVVNPVLVSTPLSQIDAVIDDLVSAPDEPEDLERERKRESDAPADALTCS